MLDRLFEIWHLWKQSQITRDELLRQSEPIRKQVGELLEQGSYTVFFEDSAFLQKFVGIF